MTEQEVQQLFVHNSFAEAKRMLIEECERCGHQLMGHENVFELKAIATQGSKPVVETNASRRGVEGSGEETPGCGASSEQVEAPVVYTAASSANGEGEAEQESASEGGEEGGVGGSEEDPEQGKTEAEGNKQEGEKQSCEKSENENGEEKKQEEKPKRRRRQRKQSAEVEQNQEAEQEGQKPAERSAEQIEAEANEKMEEAKRKMEEAQELAKRAEEKREEERRKAEEERRRKEKEAAKSNRHNMTNEVVRRLKCLHKAFLVGPAGTGKSTLAMCACRELFKIEGGLEDVVKSDKFAQISFSPDTVTADMLGFTDVNGVFHETDIIRVFRDGGLILFDEMDDADASLLVKLNTMLANRVIPTPNGMVVQNENTYIVGTANTYGTGGNSMYVGRSRLDAATLDRWKMATIFIDYDVSLERAIRERELDQKQAKELEAVTTTIREAIGANRWKQICSTRFVIDSCNMMKNGYGINQCVDTFLLSWDENNRRLVKGQIRDSLKNMAN